MLKKLKNKLWNAGHPSNYDQYDVFVRELLHFFHDILSLRFRCFLFFIRNMIKNYNERRDTYIKVFNKLQCKGKHRIAYGPLQAIWKDVKKLIREGI